MRYVATVVVIAAGYYAFTKGGKALLLTGPAGAFWPGAGLGIAILYLGGLRWWPAILLGDLGSLLADVVELGVPPGSALAEAAGDMARTLVAVVILRRLVGPRIALDRLQQVGAVLVAVVTGAAISASVALLALRAGDVITASEMSVFWRSWWLGDLSGGLVVLPLALAWARPLAPALRGRGGWEGALMIATVVALSAGAMSADQPLTYLVFPAFIWAALRLGSQGATLAVAVAVVIAVWAASNELGPFVEHSPTDSALELQLYITFAALTTLCLAAIVSERRRAAVDLAESQRREGERAAEERQRIARDLHDSASQSLFASTLHLRTAERALAREGMDRTGRVRQELDQVGQLTRGALAEIRAAIFELRPDALGDMGLVAALATHAAAVSAREELAIAVHGPQERLPLAPDTEQQLYLLVREALANTVKHAHATAAAIDVTATDGVVAIEVSDDGRGFAPARGRAESFGLRSMHSRAAELGGRLEIRSSPSRGTVVHVAVPAATPRGQGRASPGA